jgi:hypothetical protein
MTARKTSGWRLAHDLVAMATHYLSDDISARIAGSP